MLIAIPSDEPGGLDAEISAHFGHCDAFTLVKIEDGEIGEVEVHPNEGHAQGGCMAPVMVLNQLGVDVLVAGGMGARPLQGFHQVGIDVYSTGDAKTVGEAARLFASGKSDRFGDREICGGGGGCGGHEHHHAAVERPPIEGKADVREGRIAVLEFELRDTEGTLFDSSEHEGPMQYLQGSGAIVGLEKGLEGLEPGDERSIEVKAAEGFGERDEQRIIEVERSIAAQDPSGHTIPLVVAEVREDVAVLDANHPLAGRDLVFDIKVVAVEQATEEEIAHGHVH